MYDCNGRKSYLLEICDPRWIFDGLDKSGEKILLHWLGWQVNGGTAQRKDVGWAEQSCTASLNELTYRRDITGHSTFLVK
jgi:hypothetical protein